MPKEESLEERLKNAEKTASQITDKNLKAEINREIKSIKSELKKYGKLESQKARLEAEKGDLARRCRELEAKLKANPGQKRNNPGNFTYEQYYDVGLQAYKAELYDKAIIELHKAIELKPDENAIILLYKTYVWANDLREGLDYFAEKSLLKFSNRAHLKFIELFKKLIKRVYKAKVKVPNTPKSLLKKALDLCEDRLKRDSVDEMDKGFYRKYFKKIGRLYKDAK